MVGTGGPTRASSRPLRARDRWHVSAFICCALAAADAHGVGRAQAADARDDQRMIQPRDCCGLTAIMCECRIRAPSRRTHPLPGQVIAGNAFEQHHRERIRPPSWWERNRGQHPRVPSGGTHPTVVAATSARKERMRTPSRGTPSGANTAGRLSRAFSVVPPNQRMQPDAVPAARSARFWQLFQV
jgi:hypothetical protein